MACKLILFIFCSNIACERISPRLLVPSACSRYQHKYHPESCYTVGSDSSKPLGLRYIASSRVGRHFEYIFDSPHIRSPLQSIGNLHQPCVPIHQEPSRNAPAVFRYAFRTIRKACYCHLAHSHILWPSADCGILGSGQTSVNSMSKC